MDDEVGVAALVERILAREYDVTVMHSGAAALELLGRDQAFDAVLFDLMMPDVSGIALYERIASTWPALLGHLALITGGAFTTEARSFIARADLPVLEKPFSQDALRHMVASVLASD